MGGWEGRILRPGKQIDPLTLPRPALVLECAGNTGPRNHRECVWILWRLDFERMEWRELARAQAADWTWSLALRPIAVRELRGDVYPILDLLAIAQRVVQLLDKELQAIAPEMRGPLLSAIEPEFAGRLAAHLD